MKNPEKTILGNLIEFQRGFDLPKTNFKEGIYPVISSNGILGYHNEYKVKGPGLTIGRSGTVGLPNYIEDDFFPHNTSLFIKDFKGNHPKYIYYLLKTLRLNDLKSGSGVPTMNRNHLHPLEVHAHLNLEIQRKIAHVLSTLDEKIELNNRINTELEEMAKTIYDYWFVQFDFPNEEGKPYRTSGGEMEWNENLKREIPVGWKTHMIKEVVQTVLGGTPSTKNKKFWESGKNNWLSSGEMNNFPIIKANSKITDEAINKSATKLMPKGTVAISITRYIRPTILAIEACANQSVVGIYESNVFQNTYLYPFFKNEVSRYMVVRTGANQPHINKETIDETIILKPPTHILNNYYKIVNTMYNQIINNAFQNQQLSDLRDWLLPMLMNGQIVVE